MKQRKSFLLRIDPALHEQLERWAQQELRSLNGQIEYLLKEAVNRRNRQLSQDSPPSADGPNVAADQQPA
jgi:hypothetical protein